MLAKAHPPPHFPYRILWHGLVAQFEMQCPITGDLIYHGTRENGSEFDVLIKNANAPAFQADAFRRGIHPAG